MYKDLKEWYCFFSSSLRYVDESDFIMIMFYATLA